MPRRPTGNPIGRPRGSGQLGEEGTGHTRLTVRLSTPLYAALEAEAGAACEPFRLPDLASFVRTALEHFLACPQRRQTGIVSYTTPPLNGQTGNIPEALEDINGQTESLPACPAPTPRGELVARLRQMRTTMSLQQIADQLCGEGVPTPSGGVRWLKGMVHRLTAPSPA
jgi:hypothetical protein